MTFQAQGSGANVKLLQQTFSSDDSCLLDISSPDIQQLIPQVIDHLVQRNRLNESHRDEVIQRLIERENVVSTAIGHAVAVPHCYLETLTEQQVVFVRLDEGLNLRAPDGTPTRYFFFLFGPTGEAAAHLDTLALIARLMSDDEFRYDLGEADSATDLSWALERAVARSTEEPDTDGEVSEGLQRTGKLCGGIVADVKRRWPYYAGDFKDGL
ncbi:MAG: PTS sugar transporter subunit IIA, partial [Planctomycetes bacterium]|nr:PTS sugar transporter subunit IIA [Planctomycetota bacterium]